MITDENIKTYINSLGRSNSDFLEEMRRYAEDHDVPIIRREMESFIRVLLELKRPAKILEIGTAIGYSAIFMCECLPASKYIITTIENYKPRIEIARENIAASGYADHIMMIEGDAVGILNSMINQQDEPSLSEQCFDIIFLDAAKGQYITMLPDIIKLLTPGGILLADNVLTDGEIAKSRYALPRRQRTIHERMREFVWEVTHSEELTTSVIPIGDGVTLSIKKCPS